MARFASGKVFCDLEVDSGPAEDEVDGCALIPQNLCQPAGCRTRKPVGVMMIARGFRPEKCVQDTNLSATATRFQHERPMVIMPDVYKPKWQYIQQGNGQSAPMPMKNFKPTREMEEKCDSLYDSGLTESEVYHSEDVPLALNSNKTCEQVTSQLGNLKIEEDHTDRNYDVSPKDGCCIDKSFLGSYNVDDEAYYSEERTTSVQSVSVVTDENQVDWMFCEQDKEGDTQAHLLLIHKNIARFVEFLLLVPNAAYLNIQNFLLQSLLHLAVILNQPGVVRKLVARGAEVDVRDRLGNTPLHVACERGYYDCVMALTTPLDHREVKDVPYKLPYQRIPQDQDIKNYNGMTCLHLAANNDRINIVNHLITMCSADINVQEGKGGETILHQAVERSAEDLVKYLLLHRELHLEASRYDGSTALQVAEGYGNHRMVNILINAGADNTRHTSMSDSEDDLMVDGEERQDLPYDDFRIGGSLITV